MADTRRLPIPVTDVWDWQIRGACRGMDSAAFFHPEGERGPARSGREAQAKQICASCPVLAQCRAHSLAVHEPYGVWGGLSEFERDVIVRRQDRPLRVVVGPRAPVSACGSDPSDKATGSRLAHVDAADACDIRAEPLTEVDPDPLGGALP